MLNFYVKVNLMLKLYALTNKEKSHSKRKLCGGEMLAVPRQCLLVLLHGATLSQKTSKSVPTSLDNTTLKYL